MQCIIKDSITVCLTKVISQIEIKLQKIIYIPITKFLQVFPSKTPTCHLTHFAGNFEMYAIGIHMLAIGRDLVFACLSPVSSYKLRYDQILLYMCIWCTSLKCCHFFGKNITKILCIKHMGRYSLLATCRVDNFP